MWAWYDWIIFIITLIAGNLTGQWLMRKYYQRKRRLKTRNLTKKKVEP